MFTLCNADAEMECLSAPLGRDYMGFKSVSASNKTCLNWTESLKLASLLPDDKVSDAHNYCRYVPGQNWSGPSCLVHLTGTKLIRVERCDIPFCGINSRN